MDAIEVHELRKSYRSRVAVDGVGFRAAEGSVLGVLGPNGAGKTTTVECVAGLRRPDAGSVRVLGLDPFADRARVRSVLGVQLQEVALHDALTVAELVRLHRSFHRSGADAPELIEAVGLTEQAGTRFARLSGGQQQRLSVTDRGVPRRVHPVGMKLVTSWSRPERRARDLGTLVAALTVGSALPHLVLAGTADLAWREVLAVAYARAPAIRTPWRPWSSTGCVGATPRWTSADSRVTRHVRAGPRTGREPERRPPGPGCAPSRSGKARLGAPEHDQHG